MTALPWAQVVRDHAAECGGVKALMEETPVVQLLAVWYGGGTRRPMPGGGLKAVLDRERLKRGLPPTKG